VAGRPDPEEYAPYYTRYIDLVPGDDVMAVLQEQKDTVRDLLGGVSSEEAGHRYAPGKWSVREVVGHLSDNERVFAYRALRLGRGDEGPLEGFDHNAYVATGAFDRRPLPELIDELLSVREATIALLRGLDADALQRVGTANGGALSARAAMFVNAGHLEHHLEILRKYYLRAPESGFDDSASRG